MSELEEKIGGILNDPQMMRRILSMAQAMGAQANDASPAPPQPPQEQPAVDAAMLQRLAGFAQNSNIDKRERALLQALGGYLSHERIGKLEKAMRAAKLAKIASAAIGKQPSHAGR